jgi:hypothetical protein
MGVPRSVYLMGVHLMGVHLMDVHLMGVYFVGVHLTSMHLIGVYLVGVYYGVVSIARRLPVNMYELYGNDFVDPAICVPHAGKRAQPADRLPDRVWRRLVH